MINQNYLWWCLLYKQATWTNSTINKNRPDMLSHKYIDILSRKDQQAAVHKSLPLG